MPSSNKDAASEEALSGNSSRSNLLVNLCVFTNFRIHFFKQNLIDNRKFHILCIVMNIGPCLLSSSRQHLTVIKPNSSPETGVIRGAREWLPHSKTLEWREDPFGKPRRELLWPPSQTSYSET
ncbi:hypothetical protein TNCV_2763591 [Trichonephila clavipes]|nr:hypothetical protein TNCV_2763591 [Trichonephila clavipes]